MATISNLIERSKKWLNLIGCFLIYLSIGNVYSFGNLNPYITSYIRVYDDPHVTYSSSSAIFIVLSIFISLSHILGGLLITKYKISCFTTILIGSIIMDVGLGLTILAIKHSLWSTILSYGLLNGMGIGIAYVAPLKLIMALDLKIDIGRFKLGVNFWNSVVLAGYAASSSLSPFQSHLINPNDEPPLELHDSEKYFSIDQKDVLNNLPKCFYITLGIFVSLQLVGLILLLLGRDRSPQSNKYRMINERTTEAFDETRPILEDQGDQLNSLNVNYTNPKEGLSFREAVRHQAFWNLFFIYMLIGMSPKFVTGFYKTYGELFIKNDEFLSYVALGSSVINALGRVICGLIADKMSFRGYISFINLGLFVCVGAYASTQYIQIDAIFFVWTCLIYFVYSGVFNTIPAVTERTFGKKSFTAIYGVIASASVPGFLITFGLSQFLDKIHYLGEFIIHVTFNAVAFIFIYRFNVKDSTGRSV